MEQLIFANTRYSYRRVTGVERYANEVISRIGIRVRRIRPNRNLNGWSGHLWEQSRLPTLIGKDELLWSPANTGPIFVRNQIATVHDLSAIEHPEWYRRDFAIWYAFLIPRLLKTVTRIITISNFSKMRMVDLLDVPAEKITVAPGGVDRAVFYPVREIEIDRVCASIGVSRPYILMTQPGNPRKNARKVLKAWDIIRQRYPKLHLVLIGRQNSVFSSIDLPSSPAQLIQVDYVENHELAALMSGAILFLYPSEYEGFGLCALEAMACGTAVITSRAGGLLEAVGGCSYSIDISNLHGFVRAIEYLLSDSDQRADLAAKGLERAEKYSWESTATIIENTLTAA